MARGDPDVPVQWTEATRKCHEMLIHDLKSRGYQALSGSVGHVFHSERDNIQLYMHMRKSFSCRRRLDVGIRGEGLSICLGGSNRVFRPPIYMYVKPSSPRFWIQKRYIDEKGFASGVSF